MKIYRKSIDRQSLSKKYFWNALKNNTEFKEECLFESLCIFMIGD